MNIKFYIFFALCLISVCFSGCFYTTGCYMQISGEIHNHDDYSYSYATPRKHVVVVLKREPVMVVSRPIIAQDKRTYIPPTHYAKHQGDKFTHM